MNLSDRSKHMTSKNFLRLIDCQMAGLSDIRSSHPQLSLWQTVTVLTVTGWVTFTTRTVQSSSTTFEKWKTAIAGLWLWGNIKSQVRTGRVAGAKHIKLFENFFFYNFFLPGNRNSPTVEL